MKKQLKAGNSEAWGRYLKDFGIGSVNRQAQPSSSRPKTNGKGKREARPKSKLTEFDEYHCLTKNLMADVKNLDDNLNLHSDWHASDASDAENNRDSRLRLEVSVINR
jgi:hypothetical protein